MKSEVIAKVNKIGKIGFIITKVSKVLLTVGFIGCIVGAVLLAMVPKDFVTITVAGDAVIDVNLEKTPLFNVISLSSLEKLEDFGAEINSEWDINGVSYDVVSAEQNGNTITMSAKAEPYKLNIGGLSWTLIPAMIAIAACYVVLHFTGKLCETFQHCKTPFTDEIVKGIRNLAISIIPMALISSVVENITRYAFSGDTDFVLGVDVMTVVLVVLIFMLASIFKYGAMLQQESDETL